MYFLKKDHLSFSAYRIRSYFREKEMSSFLMIQERSYSSAIFWKDHLFRTLGKRKYAFLCSVPLMHMGTDNFPLEFTEKLAYLSDLQA